MSTISIQIPEELKKQVAEVAQEEGVSVDEFICSCLSMGVAQERTAMFFSERLEAKDRQLVRERFAEIMSESREGEPPSHQEIRRLIKEE